VTDSEERTAQSEAGTSEQTKAKAPSQQAPAVSDQTKEQEEPRDAARLVCVEGIVKGKEFPIAGRFVIGRREGGQVVLDDALVSRRHADISYEDKIYVLRDLGSRNGTRINGRRIKEKILRNGDRVYIGRTKFRFVLGHGKSTREPGIISSERVLDKAREKPIIPFLVILAIAFFAIKFIYPSLQQNMAVNRGSTSNGNITTLSKAMEAMKVENYTLAKELLYQILAIRPDDKEALALMKSAVDEEMYLLAMKEFETLKAEGKTQGAIESLKKIHEGSVYYKKAQEELKNLRQMFVEPMLEEARGFLREKKWDQAREKLEMVVESDPDNAVAVEFLSLLDYWEANETREKEQHGDKKIERKNREKKSELMNEKRDPDDEALIRYMQGDLDGAISLWQENSGEQRARERFVLATSVRKYMKISETESKKGRMEPSVQALTRALTFHERIAEGKNSPTGKTITSSLADVIAGKGEEELSLGRFSDAYASFNKAIKVDEGNRKAQEGMAKLGQKAEEIFRQAYLIEKVNLEEAMEKWKEVMSMVPPENEYYTKSQEKIAAYKK